MKLDAKTVADLTLPPGKTDFIAWDSELSGFGLRLRAGGRRVWVAQYRVNGHTRRSTLGPAETLTPAEARLAARRVLAGVILGNDPQADKAAKRQQATRTFRSVVSDYIAAKTPNLRPASLRISRLYLTGPYFRPLHQTPVTAITRTDVASCVKAITRDHSAATAAAARRALSAFFRWVIADDLLSDDATNPVTGSHRPADPKPRNRVLSDGELVALWKACGDDNAGKVVRLLILLGSRRSEIGAITVSELNLATGVWELPAERSKNKRSHTITLPPAALKILESVPRTGQDAVFGNRGFVSWADAKARLDRALTGAMTGPWRLHDIRRTVATRMADIGVEPHIVEAVLNHHGGHRRGVAGTYNRSTYERAVASALVRWSEHVLALVEGRESNVVALRSSNA